MKYYLRVGIHADCYEQQTEDIIWACKYAHIEEVLLCEAAYVVRAVAHGLSYHKKMADIFAIVTKKLKQNGIACSMYVKSIVGHEDGKIAPEDVLPFEKFVGHSLTPSYTEPCILGEAWQDYAAQVLAEYAKCGFKRMMLDDDFRSTSHAAGQRGCFCPIHAQKTSALIGREVTGEDLLNSILYDDEENMRVRHAWLDANQEGELLALAKMEQAVHAVDPKVQLGLMNSGVHQHAYEGRDMERMLKTMAGENVRPLSRPPSFAYTDNLKFEIVGIYSHAAYCIQNDGKDTEYVSEVDNYPRSIYAKSVALTDLEMRLHSLLDISGMTLNLFDHYATPYSYSQPILDLLRNNFKLYNKIAKLRAGKKQVGVGFPFKRTVQYHLKNRTHTVGDAVYAPRVHDVLSMLGIPVMYDEGDVNFIVGDLALCFSDEEITRMLKKGLFLDGIAAKHLCDRGFGDKIGVSYAGECKDVCYEVFDCEAFNKNYHGQYMPCCSRTEYPILFDLLDGAFSAGHLMDKDKKVFGSAVAVFENKDGGRVATFTAPILYENTWLFPCRKEQFENLLRYISKNEDYLIAENSVNVMPLYFEDEKGNALLALANVGLDTQKVKVKGFGTIKVKPLELKLRTK